MIRPAEREIRKRVWSEIDTRIRSKGERDYKLAQRIGLTSSQLYALKIGRNSPGVYMLRSLVLMGADPVYILTGRRSDA